MIVLQDDIQIIETIDTSEINITLKSDGIVYVYFKNNLVINVEAQKRFLEFYNTITNKQLTPFVFESGDDVTTLKEAREYAVLVENESPCSAIAIVATNLAYKLIANFYLQVNKPQKPYKVFNTQGEAIEWLKLFVK